MELRWERQPMEDRQFRGRYQRRDGDVAEYDFHPLGLVFRESVVYLVATVWDYQDPRHYALHRFEQCELKAERSNRPPGFKLDAYVQAGGFDYVDPQAPKMRLRVRFDAATAHPCGRRR